MILIENFIKLIKDHLLSKKALSVIRYGDGETMMLDDDVSDRAFILKKVLGYIPSNSDIQAMNNNLIAAYKDCDIIGIPTERHLRRLDNWGKSLTVFKKVIGEEILLAKLKTSIDIFYELLSTNLYEELFTKLDTLNYISCRNLDEAFKSKFNIKQVRSFIIAPEPTYTSGYVGDKHFPEQFNRIGRWMENICIEGSLCLVGAGIPGKIYNNWFRDLGGISLDVGAVFDLWAGFKTRGAGRGLDVVDETFKL